MTGDSNTGAGAGTHPHHHAHGQNRTSDGPTSALIPVQLGSSHPVELRLTADENNRYFYKPVTRDIPGFPASLGNGFKVCLGLTPENKPAVTYKGGKEEIDTKMIYVRA